MITQYSESDLARWLAAADKLGGDIQFFLDPNNGNPNLAIGASLKRRSLVIFPATSGTLVLNTIPTFVNGQGINITNSSPGTILRIEDVGDLVRKPWYALFRTPGAAFGWIECMEPTHCYYNTPRTNGTLTPWSGHT